MRTLNQHIARQANAEDGVKGRFWAFQEPSAARLEGAAGGDGLCGSQSHTGGDRGNTGGIGLYVDPYCPRCGAALEWRRPRSIKATWALVAAAAICYISANLLPVLGTASLGVTEFDAIIGGVMFFATVVVLTMIAAGAFDPRLIRDAGTEKES